MKRGPGVDVATPAAVHQEGVDRGALVRDVMNDEALFQSDKTLHRYLNPEP
jgi:hypothetical protein